MVWFIIFVVFILCVTGTIWVVVQALLGLAKLAINVTVWTVTTAFWAVMALIWCLWWCVQPKAAMAARRARTSPAEAKPPK